MCIRDRTTVVDAKYDQAFEMLDGMARVKNGELYGAIDSTGKEIMTPRYISLLDLEMGHVVVGEESGLGLLDRSGKQVLPSVYDAISLVNENLARVELNDRFGYLRLSDGRFIWKEEGFDKVGPE